MGGPFEGKYRNASVLHDVSYEQHNRPWDGMRPHVLQRHALQRRGAVEAGTMYYSLYKFGHHWKFELKKRRRSSRRSPRWRVTKEFPRVHSGERCEVNDARDWIRGTEPSLEQIEQRADAEAHQ